MKGNLQLALDNVRRINEAKRKLGSKTPRLIWEFHVFEHNQHEVERAMEMAAELEMDVDIAKGWVGGKEWDPDGPYKFFAAPSVDGCEFLWQRAVVNIDAGVSPCCGTFFREDDFGTVDEHGFRAVWNNEKFQEARKLFKAGPASDVARATICHGCPETITRQDYIRHMAAGGLRHDFRGRFSANDGFNYFFTRKPPKPAPNGEVIDLQPTEVAAGAAGDAP